MNGEASNIKRIISSTLLRHIPSELLDGPIIYGRGFFDKLCLDSPSTEFEFLKSDCQKMNSFDGRKVYRNGQRYKHRKTEIGFTIMSGNRFTGDGKSRLELNPRHFSSYRQLCDLVRKIIGEENFQNNHEIRRLDFQVRFLSRLYPVDLFLYSMWVKNKRLVSSFQDWKFDHLYGNASGFTLGKRPHRVICYDRDAKEKTKGRFNQTILEVQLSKNDRWDLPARTIQELPRITSFSPYKKLVFFDMFRVKSGLDIDQEARALEFQLMVHAKGFHNARAEANRRYHRNFKRDFRKAFSHLRIGSERVPLKTVLKTSLRRGLQSWIDSDPLTTTGERNHLSGETTHDRP